MKKLLSCQEQTILKGEDGRPMPRKVWPSETGTQEIFTASTTALWKMGSRS